MTNVWTQSTVAADPQSDDIVASLAALARRKSVPAYISLARGPRVYVVGADTPLVPVLLDFPGWSPPLAAALGAGVPIPDDAKTSATTDHAIIIYQPSTDVYCELWIARHLGDHWGARWGGITKHFSINPGYFTAADYQGASGSWGTSASGLTIWPGLITPNEVQDALDGTASIPHALAMALPNVRGGRWAWPAQRTDGSDTNPLSIPYGARFRLRADYDLAGITDPIARELARAAQTYGIITRERDGQFGAVSFDCETPHSPDSMPWSEVFQGKSPDWVLHHFPWEDLILEEMDLRPRH